MNAETPIDVVAEFLPLFGELDVREAAAALAKVPVLVIAADNDLLTPVGHGRDLADALPHAEYVEASDSGHMVMLERHELVTERIGELIGRVRSGRRRRWPSRTKVRATKRQGGRQ
jgi:pimeloyl-ACP methyl ester carboxylesterase